MTIQTNGIFDLNRSVRGHDGMISSVPRPFIFTDRLRGNSQGARQRGTVPGSGYSKTNRVLDVHVVKNGTFGSFCQAHFDADSSSAMNHSFAMDNKADFSKRLAAVLDRAGGPVKYKGQLKKIAVALEVSPRTISNWVNGDKLPSMDNVISLALLLRVSAEWLLTGQGLMIPEEAPTEEEREYLKVLRALSADDKEKVFQMTQIFTPRGTRQNLPPPT